VIHGLLLALFWFSVAFVLWAYAGFPLVLALRALRPGRRPETGGELPFVSYVVVVYNERAVIDAKLANIEAIEYPRDRLQVLVVSDGSDDGTDERVLAHAGPTPVQLIALPRLGKNAALNAGVAEARHEVLVFSDADSMLEPGALKHLVAPLSDESIGGVAGDYHYTGAAEGTSDEGEGERTYWSVDRVWKQLECHRGSVTSATGQIYAIRRAYFTPVPDGVTDDFFVSTGVMAHGRRLYFEPAARASGPVAASTEAEFRRKVRMMGRGLSSVWQRRTLLDARTTGFYAIQLFSHKVMRRLVGLPLIGLFISAPLLAWGHSPTWLFSSAPTVETLYVVAAVGQLAFHALALVGWIARRHRLGQLPLFSLPLFFDMVNLCGLLALSDFLRGRQNRGWVPHRPVANAPAAGEGR